MNSRTISAALLLFATGLLLFVGGDMLLPSSRSVQPVPAAKPRPEKRKAVPLTNPKKARSVQPDAPAKQENSPTDQRPALPPAPRTVEDVMDRFEDVARNRYYKACRRAGIAWPPKRLVLLAFKREKRLEIWGSGSSGGYSLLAAHKVLAASGGDGPKRYRGDEQVPEGFYGLTELNPNSAFHLSIRVEYPNREDIEHSKYSLQDMGGDIYIHGNQLSIGCLAMGDRTIEELFPLAALIPRGARRIIIAPFDFRRHPHAPLPREEKWVMNLYGRIRTALREFPVK